MACSMQHAARGASQQRLTAEPRLQRRDSRGAAHCPPRSARRDRRLLAPLALASWEPAAQPRATEHDVAQAAVQQWQAAGGQQSQSAEISVTLAAWQSAQRTLTPVGDNCLIHARLQCLQCLQCLPAAAAAVVMRLRGGRALGAGRLQLQPVCDSFCSSDNSSIFSASKFESADVRYCSSVEYVTAPSHRACEHASTEARGGAPAMASQRPAIGAVSGIAVPPPARSQCMQCTNRAR